MIPPPDRLSSATPPGPLLIDSMRAQLLSYVFMVGAPAMIAAGIVGLAPWWLIAVPLLPVWWSFISGTIAAHNRRRMIRRPTRALTLDEQAAELSYKAADAAFLSARDVRAEALCDLARERLLAARRPPSAPPSRGQSPSGPIRPA